MYDLDFTGKVVLVTGASRGIGREIARMFAERGGRVAVHYNANAAMAQDTLDALAGEGHMLVQADIADPDAVKRMVDSVVEQMGRLDVLVNNAGIAEEHPLMEVDYAEWLLRWERTLRTNLMGAANAIYCAAQHMLKQGGGRIVNVSSRGAFRGEPTNPAYGASKAGMNAMGQSLARALGGHNIFIGTVAPGWVETEMARDALTGPDREFVLNQSSLGRVAKPEEVAYAVLFLASEGAEFMTGAIIDVNGASYLRT